MPEKSQLRPDEFCVIVNCDGFHPDDVEEVQRSLAQNRYDFKVDVVQNVRTENYPELFVIGIDTKLTVRFSVKWFYGHTRRGGVKTILTAVDDVLDKSPHDRDLRPRVSLDSNGQELITTEKWLRPRTKKHSWTRDHRLALGILILTGVAAVAAVFAVPEFRRLFHLDAPQPTNVETKPTHDVTQSPPHTQTESLKPAEPLTSQNPQPSQKTVTRVKGNGNVAGNNVAGNNNVVGNNHQMAPTANAPNGIAISGGTVIQPTVNNFTPSNRRLSDSQKATLKSCLAEKTGTYTVSAIANNGEAYQYAQDFSEVFSGAGWKNEQTIPVAIIMIAGGMWSGVRISVHGTWDETTKTASLIDGAPEMVGLNCLRAANFPATAIPWSDMKTGSIRVDVSELPTPPKN
jgi:hypothetical protein